VTERHDVDAASRDIGRDEHAIFTALEFVERARALRLRTVAVNAFGGDVMLRQRRGEAISARFRPRERDRAEDVIVLEQF
jgi:hypothetical protein